MDRNPAIYILASKYQGTLYSGVTSDLPRRIWQHKSKLIEGFTSRYNVNRLVYFELAQSMVSAIEREKQIKAGSRQKKILLIESINPHWRDLYQDIL